MYCLFSGLTADVGALQRLPRIIGNQSLVNEIAFTARKIEAAEARECGLVSKLYDDKERLVEIMLPTSRFFSFLNVVHLIVSFLHFSFSFFFRFCPNHNALSMALRASKNYLV